MSGLVFAKALSQLLLPPGGLFLLGLIGLFYRRRIWGRALLALSLVLLYVLATEPVRNALLQPLEFRYPALAVSQVSQQGAAIVLLGGGIYERAPEFGGTDQLEKDALLRTAFAAELARRTGLPIYASGSGDLHGGTEAEGEIMRRWLIKWGVAPAQVEVEKLARNTWENAVNTKAMLAQRGINKVVLVTSAWHMPRAVYSFAAQGLQVIPAPCAYLTSFRPFDMRSFLPHWHTLADSGDALHEYLGYLWYRLRYS